MATLMEASMFIMFNMHVCACACMHGVPPHTNTHPYPNPLNPIPGGPPESVKIQ